MRGCRGNRLKTIVLWIFILFIVPLLYVELTFPVRYIFKHSNVNSSCVIPNLDPFDESVTKFMWEPSPLVCDPSPYILYADENGILKFNESALNILGLNAKHVNCESQILERKDDDITVDFQKAALLNPPVKVNADFYHVLCKSNDGNVVFDKLLTNVAKEAVKRSVPVQDESLHQLSVVMFGIDSVSRSGAIRKLPKTVRFLTQELHSYDFKGYMKVGENTLPNLTPLLTGRRAWSSELPITDYATEIFDKFPLLWNNFSRSGYATMYAEDMPNIATFNFLTRGFLNQPTDHYMRPFYLGIPELSILNDKIRSVFMYLENKHVKFQGRVSALCYKDKPKHLHQIDYLKQFMTAYKNKREFLFSFLVELSHEYQSFLSYGDDDFYNFFKWLKSERHIENTVLIFFSDHGARIEEIRSTFVGRIEDRMPMLHIVIPDKIRSSYPDIIKNLDLNVDRLATHFDVYQTLVDILNQNFKNPTKGYVDGTLRGISLFQQLPIDRSCVDAWIPENYCACYTSSPVDTKGAVARDLSTTMIQDLNKRFEHQPKCAKLSVNGITYVRLVSNGLQHASTENTRLSLLNFFKPESSNNQYELGIQTVPGHGQFEATYAEYETSKFRLLGDIIRTNKYGKQSSCITEKLLRPLCFCTEQLE